MLVSVISGFKACVQTELNAFILPILPSSRFDQQSEHPSLFQSAQPMPPPLKYAGTFTASWEMLSRSDLSARLGEAAFLRTLQHLCWRVADVVWTLHKLNADGLLVLDHAYQAQWLIAHLLQQHPKPHRNHAKK